MLKYFCYFFLMLIGLTACNTPKAPEWLRPNNRVFEHMPINGSPEYQQGWKDGCESGMTAHTNNFYQSFYTFKQDNSLITNEVYYKAWQDANAYCRLYAYALLKEADLRRSNPNTHRFLATDKPVYGLFQWLTNWGQPLTNRR